MNLKKWPREGCVCGINWVITTIKNFPQKILKLWKNGFWGLPDPLRFLILFFGIIIVSLLGVTEFALGIALSILILCNFSYDFTHLGLVGEKKVLLATIYFLIILLIKLSMVIAMMSEKIGDHWQLSKKRDEFQERVEKSSFTTKLLLTGLKKEVEFFGQFDKRRWWIHSLIFWSSLVALLIK